MLGFPLIDTVLPGLPPGRGACLEILTFEWIWMPVNQPA
jgi:hypothetical protein